MLRIIRTGPVLCALALLAACGTSEKKGADMPEGMYALSLAKYGKPFTIWVPDTSAAHLKIEESGDGALNVLSGPRFGLSIYEQAADLSLKKEDIRNDEVNKLKTLISDEPSAIMWESAITSPEFHFTLNK